MYSKLSIKCGTCTECYLLLIVLDQLPPAYGMPCILRQAFGTRYRRLKLWCSPGGVGRELLLSLASNRWSTGRDSILDGRRLPPRHPGGAFIAHKVSCHVSRWPLYCPLRCGSLIFMITLGFHNIQMWKYCRYMIKYYITCIFIPFVTFQCMFILFWIASHQYWMTRHARVWRQYQLGMDYYIRKSYQMCTLGFSFI